MTEPLGELPARGLSLRVAELLLLAGLAAALFLGWGFLSQPPLHERAGPEALPHLSVDPLPLGSVEWRADAVGPGMAIAQTESLLRRTTFMLVVLFGAVGGLGQMALAGVVAIARRSELRLRRALGAPRNRLAGALTREAIGSLTPSLLVGAALALLVWLLLSVSGTYTAAVPGPVLPNGLWILLVPGGLVLWSLFTLLVDCNT